MEASDMVTGLYLTSEGKVVVDYGKRKIPISAAQYKANGYKPAYEKLTAKLPPKANGCIPEGSGRERASQVKI
jgi:hypothetical protein